MSLIPRYNWDYSLTDFLRTYHDLLVRRASPYNEISSVFGWGFVPANAGRTCLFLILKALDLAPGSEVGVPLFCCPVVFDAIRQAGLKPRFIDIGLDDYCVSARDVQRKAAGLSALVVVHMFGHPADMDRISSACNGIPIIEDCAQSLFSRYNDMMTGFLTGRSFFSFRSGKYISAGEGGLILADNREVLGRVGSLVSNLPKSGVLSDLAHSAAVYAKSALYNRPWYGAVGYPLGKRVDRALNLTAKSGFAPRQIRNSDLAVVARKIRGFQDKVTAQRNNSLLLLKMIRADALELPRERPGSLSNYSQFAIRLNDSRARNYLAAYLFRSAIDSSKYGDDVLDLARREYGYTGDCPNSEIASKTVLVVPNYYALTSHDLDYIAERITAGAREIRRKSSEQPDT